MKTLKFRDYLVPLVLDGSKVSTWRLNDDKDLQIGDEITLINWNTGEEFATARITHVREKPLGEVDEADYAEGHERHDSKDTMLAEYRKYYGEDVTFDALLKLVKFELI